MSRILMVLDREFPPDIRVENEIEILLKNDHEVHIACFTRKDKSSLETLGKLFIHRKPVSDFIYKSSVASLTLPFYFNFWKKFIRSILSTQSFDAIHIHDLPLSKVGAGFRKSGSIKLVIDLHENWPAFLKISQHTNTLSGKILSPIFLWRGYEKKILRQADQVIVVVSEAKTRLIELGISGDKITVISNTINLTDLHLQAPVPHEDSILYYAGGINYHRGLQNVIRAMHASGNQHVKFHILGDGRYTKTLTSLVERLSLQNRVIFFGYQPFKKVMEMLADSDFAIIPHLKTEHTDSTIPHKLFQYMYAGIPVIASDCLPIKRILEETGAGIVYPSDNIESLRKVLDQLGTMDRSKMGIKGKKAVVDKYNWNNDGNALLNLYAKI